MTTPEPRPGAGGPAPSTQKVLPVAGRVAEAVARFCRPDGNDWGVALCAETLREVQRPFSRLQWCKVTGDGVAADVVVKGMRGSSRAAHGAALAEASAARRLDAVFANQPTLGVIAPLRTYPDLSVVITPAVAASSLAALIEERAAWWPSAETRHFLEHGCTLAGAWLRQLHLAAPASASWTLDTLREDLGLRVRLLQEFPGSYGLSASLAGRIERWLDAQLSDAPVADLICSETHRDYSPSNMLYDGEVLRVLDFGTLREAPRLLDTTRFLHQVQMLALKPRYRKATRRALQHAFAVGYDDAALLASPLVPVFTVRHELSHWLGAARRIRRSGRATTSFLVCLTHARTLRRLVSTTDTTPPTP